ncbi:MAG TPA: electron transport complex subunit E [Candidatus Egerieousia sp.]|nr:electron transport complex subunit E [Candidatus Egerieousia sp.]HPT05103.1 electron transport complex subunit E [Candidatus Egerieousia sp.]
MNKFKLTLQGIIKNNPTFVLVLGMCPTLATSTSALNGMGMGLATMIVLACSNMGISALAPHIPDKVRIPCYIVVIAAFVTVVQFLMQAYTPALYKTLGIYVPLIVVNCIVLGRAEAYANKNTVIDSLCDGVGVGLGFTLSLTCIGIIREFLGSLSFMNMKLFDADGMLIFILPAGAFIVLGYLMVLFNSVTNRKKANA